MPKWARINRKTLFAKLMLGFLLVILISFAFNITAYRFFYGQMRNQLIETNTESLTNAAVEYEKQLSQIDVILTQFYFDHAISSLNKDNIGSDYPLLNALAEDFQTVAANYNLDIENVFLYYPEYGFVVHKNGYAQVKDMFEKYFVSSTYGVSFWNKQYDSKYHLKLFPAEQFRVYSSLNMEPSYKTYMPMIVKHQAGMPYYIGALINPDQLFQGSRQVTNDRFYITDDSGKIYYSQGAMQVSLPALAEDRPYTTNNNEYYFHYRGDTSGLTYVKVVPNQKIVSQMIRMNVLLLALFGLSVFASMIIAVLLSVRFKNPVQRIVEALRNQNPSTASFSKIYEYELIGQELERIIGTLQRKNSLLQKYSYLDKIKSIPILDKEMAGIPATDRSFHLIIFQIQRYEGVFGNTAERLPQTTNYLETIHSVLEPKYKDSITMQVEKNRIVSLIFSATNRSSELRAYLELFVERFEKEGDQVQLTIAFAPTLWKSDQFTAAYEQAGDMIRSRKLVGGIQIIDSQPVPTPIALWTLAEERDFASHLESGNREQLLALARTVFQRLEKQEASAWQYRKFGEGLLSKLLMALMTYKIDTRALNEELSPFDEFDRFRTKDEFEAFISMLLERASTLIREKREQRNPIVESVIAYIENHYNEDIYQDLIADRLHISTGYLRNHFKEKTGINLSDYLDDFRIKKAKEMLVASNDKIQEIAAKVGYQNANSFTRMFRRITGYTPGEYRRERQAIEQ